MTAQVSLPLPLPGSPPSSVPPPTAGAGCGRGHVHHWWIEPSDVRQGNETLNAVCLRGFIRCWRTFPKVVWKDSWHDPKEVLLTT